MLKYDTSADDTMIQQNCPQVMSWRKRLSNNNRAFVFG